jgi:imidazolonepropionase-like amidohydrolase
MLTRFAAVSLSLLACGNRGATQPEPARVDAGAETSDQSTLVGGTVVGVGPADVVIEGKLIAAGAARGQSIDVSGKYLVPAFIDSHVHLAYLPVGPELRRHGVVAAVDMAAPLASLGEPTSLVVLRSGPMITAVAGYPTRSWGSAGYGLEVATPADARQAVDELQRAGAALIKIPLTVAPSLDLETASAAVARAHELGLKVAAHALEDLNAATAASAGVDVLAHTPTEALSASTVEAWEGRSVVSTLAAFGAGAVASDNLRRLRAGGVTVLYGTDLGNTQTAGIQANELGLLASAGLSPQEIIDAGTSAPAAYWGLDELGAIAPGKRASLLVLNSDPLLDPAVLATPESVYVDGVRVGP